MKIDWFTVVAQVINFLVLVWLLKRFLYKPVLNAIDEREKRITAQLLEAASKKEEAEKERVEYEEKNQAFEQERKKRLNEVLDEARSEKERLLDEARVESRELRKKLESSLMEEQKTRSDELKRRIQAEVFALTGKALSDLASLNIEESITETLIDRLRNMKDEERVDFKNALESAGDGIMIKSAFEMPPKKQQALEKTIREVVNKNLSVEYQTDPSLFSGIEINTKNFKLAWNLRDYLAAVKEITEQQKEKNAGA